MPSAKFFLPPAPKNEPDAVCSTCKPAEKNLSLEEVLGQQTERDRSDQTRSVGPLVPAADAIRFSTDSLTEEEVVNRLEKIVRDRMANT